jgi:Rps23 Pro-64 3,4-dihydroxylase Tpa1-like proline 4-hydroxylase
VFTHDVAGHWLSRSAKGVSVSGQQSNRQPLLSAGSCAPAVILDEFLSPEELAGLISFTLGSWRKFSPSEVLRYDGVSLIDGKHRRSRVLFDLGPYHWLFHTRLLTFLPYVLARLMIRPFGVSSVEMQLTGTNHNEFFRPHTDNDGVEKGGRQITFVYFFHREPRGFGGGELRIFNTRTEPSHPVPYRLVCPLQNQVVFFQSSYLHEILPVVCPSGRFADSRFTVNGWYHR